MVISDFTLMTSVTNMIQNGMQKYKIRGKRGHYTALMIYNKFLSLVKSMMDDTPSTKTHTEEEVDDWKVAELKRAIGQLTRWIKEEKELFSEGF
jgi:hypothetical protein